MPTTKLPRRSVAGVDGSTSSMSAKPGEQLLEQDAQLQAGQRGAEAVVAAVGAEGDVRVRVASHVEAVRVGEHRLVAVGRRVQQQHPVALVDLLAAQLDVARRGAVHVLHRRRPAEHLLDRRRDQRRVGAQQGELVGVAQQRVDARRR